MPAVLKGDADITRAVADLASRVPEPLAPLAGIAYDYRWSWTPGADRLFIEIDPARWELCTHNPVRLLQEASVAGLERAAGDAGFLARVAEVEEALRAERDAPAREVGPVTAERPIAFFCAEYGIHESFPIYSGGLGALAGDILKEAADRALPMVAVGLLYRQGYFRQRVDGTGWQHEYWVPTDPDRAPAALVTGDDGRPLTVSVPIGDRDVVAQLWRVDVGRVPLFLLDTERPENDGVTRWLTARLYDGDPITRLGQYALLGIGGVRALAAVGVDPGVLHLNEGHASFASLELIHTEQARGASLEEAIDAARRRTIFTTHTPVPAGNDTYPGEVVAGVLGRAAREVGLDAWDLVRMGRTRADDQSEPFGVTQFALHTTRAANAVSRRHGEVARSMWHGLWPERAVDEVPITHVTNGVHEPSWLGAGMRALLDRHLGEDWLRRAEEPTTWEAVDGIGDEELWDVRREQRAALVEYVRERSVLDRLARGDTREYVQAAAHAFDPEVLTIGFARRVATYKRLHLLLQDRERSLAMFADGRPVQLIIAGKAHPRDEEAKRLVQHLFTAKDSPAIASRVVFLDDYDLGVARRLVQGCDVWLNLPRPPLEASGTSGMKNAVNGGLHLSVLDGWWWEGFDGANGWALPGEVDPDHGAQDHRDAAEFARVLAEEVVPEFYDRDAAGVPRDWVARVRASLKTLGPQFSAGRMLEDYERRLYEGAGVPTPR
jgi:glycogen phosphorylase